MRGTSCLRHSVANAFLICGSDDCVPLSVFSPSHSPPAPSTPPPPRWLFAGLFGVLLVMERRMSGFLSANIRIRSYGRGRKSGNVFRLASEQKSRELFIAFMVVCLSVCLSVGVDDYLTVSQSHGSPDASADVLTEHPVCRQLLDHCFLDQHRTTEG